LLARLNIFWHSSKAIVAFLDAVNLACTLMLCVSIFGFVIDFITGYFNGHCGPAFRRDLLAALRTALMYQNSTFYDEKTTGLIFSRLTNDIREACHPYTGTLLRFGRLLFEWITRFIVCVSQSWKATVFLTISHPRYPLTNRYGNQLIEQMWFRYNEREANAAAKTEEIMTSFRRVRSMKSASAETSNFKRFLYDVHDVVSQTCLVHGARAFVSVLIHWGLHHSCWDS
jgi:ABC-type multidrug transport system fused ATPase/permease subunit